MTHRIYIRWAVILVILLLIVLAAVQRYHREVRSMTPDQVVHSAPAGLIRVVGRVGSLVKSEPSPDGTLLASFKLVSENNEISVIYEGEAPDNLRELKELVAIGRWDTESERLMAGEMDLVPNYGFVIAAYLVLIPFLLFLFTMERRVTLLYNEIKETRAYEAEAGELE